MEKQPEGDILDAVQSGDIATVKRFLDEGVPVDLTDEEGWSLLHHAAALGQVEVINLLREKGCSVDLIDNEGRTPLHYAATNGDIEIIRLLIAMGNNVNSVDNEGNTPLKWSVMCEQNAAIDELTKHGGTVEIEEGEPSADNLDRSALLLRFQDPGHILGDGNNEVCQSNQTELSTDIQHINPATKLNDSYKYSDHNSHQTDLVTTQQCMDTNADTTQQEGDIFEAAQCGDTATVKSYLDLGVPVDVTDEDGWSPVHHAIAHHQVEVIRLLMDRGCLMNPVKSKKYLSKEKRVTHTSEATIFEAAQCGDTATVKGYLDLGVPVDVTDEDGWSPVHHAIAHRQVEVIRLLMDRGCLMNPVKNRKQATKGSDPHITTEGGSRYSTYTEKELYHYVFEAARCGDTATIQSYLNSGGPVDLTDKDGRTLLHCAAGEGQIKVVELLIKRGCRIDQVDKNGWTPSIYATACGHVLSVQLIKQQLSEQYLTDSVDNQGRPVLHSAAQYGQIHMIEMLAEQGLDVNIGYDKGWTPLHYAATNGQLESVRTLLRLGGRESMTKVAGAGGTPLHQAVVKGHKDIVSLLLNEGCPINVVDSRGRSVLHTAAECGEIHLIEMLAEQGLDVNIGDDEGLTPLHAAAACGQLESLYTLLRLGGRKSMTKVAGNAGTPLHLAVELGHKEIVSLLLNEGCPINVVDSRGRSVLHTAAECGEIHLIEMLAEQGLNVNIGDNEGCISLHAAAASGQIGSVHTLLRLGGRESMTKVAGNAGTPLHQAVAKGHKDIVSLLLNEGCPINVVYSEGRSVLHIAAQFGKIPMIEMLAEQGLDVNIGDDKGWTPLHNAAYCGQLDSVHTLLRLGGRESMTKVASTGGTPLHQAVGKGNKDIVSLLLNEGCPINVVDGGGSSVLHIAAECGQIHMIKMLAEQGLDVNIGNDVGMTPLHVAAACDQTKALRTLLILGGRKSMTKIVGNAGTPLHQAVGKGHKDIVSLLLDEGCPINVVDSEGRSMLHSAAQFGQIHMIEMLAEQGLDVNIGDDKGLTPLHYAAVYGQRESVLTLLRLGGRESMTKVAGTRGTPLHQAVAWGHKDIVSLLLNEGCPINVVDSRGRSVLHIAAQHGQIHMMEMLAEQGLNVNKGDDESWTPLHHAAASGQLELVCTLLRLGGRESMTKVAGTCGTPLHQAVVKGHKDIVSLLLNEGCPINVVDGGGSSVLHIAAECGQIHLIEMLAEQGLDVNIGNDVGMTPLHVAAACDQTKALRTLLILGGRKSMTKIVGNAGTPLHQAVVKGHKDIVSLLLDEGCPINVVDSEGRSMLHYAAQFGQIHMIEMLAEQGLDVNIGDDKGLTPLHYAAVYGQRESVLTLLRLGGRESMTKVAGTRGTPLHQAVARGHKDIVSLLLNEGCPINVVGSALHCAVQYGQIHMIEMLVEHGCDVNIGTDEGWTSLHNAAAMGKLESVRTLLRLGGRESMTKVAGNAGTPLHQAVEKGHKDIVSLLLNEGCPINVVDSRGRSVLHIAAQHGQNHMMEMLTEQGLNVNKGDDESWTPLHHAAASGQLELVCTLLRLGGRESMTKVAGIYGTPLHLAIAIGHKDIVSLLLNEGCPINVVNGEGRSVLHVAAAGGQIHMIRMLADQGLDVNKGDDEGMTPLHDAAACGELESVRALLRLGGRESMTKIVGNAGTPLHQAVGKGHKDIVSLLLNEGCPINVVNSIGKSVLHFAAQGCQIDMIEMLAEQGLDVNIGDDDGLTPLHYAAERGHITTFNGLVSVGGDIHLMDKFGMKCSDYTLIRQNFVTVIQFCVACGLECDDEDLLGVISALSANNLLDMSRILCLAAVCGDISLFDVMVTSQFPLNQQKMPNIATRLSSLSGGKKLPDQFHVSEEPLNPLHISILSEYFSISWNINFIEKLTSHPHTRYTVNELFPNGLSPLDVARRFELHDIAVIIERAGGGPGAWADLPNEIEDRAIDRFTTLKELRRGLGEDVISRIVSLLGYPLVISDQQEVEKILEEKPKRSLLQKQVLSSLKYKRKWERVGDILEVDENILKKISEEATDDDDAYYSMLKHWLEHGRNVSWKTLLDAVGDFETKKTVDHITDKIVEELAPSQVSIQIGSFHFNLQNMCSTTHIHNYIVLCTSQQFPYTCNVCMMAFTGLNSMHLSSHSGKIRSTITLLTVTDPVRTNIGSTTANVRHSTQRSKFIIWAV